MWLGGSIMSLRFVASILLSCSFCFPAIAQDQSPPTQQQTMAANEIDHMNWQKAGDYTLPASQSKLTIPAG